MPQLVIADIKSEVKEESSNIGSSLMEVESGNAGEDELLPGTTLFVKNLNFKTTDEALHSAFASQYRIRSAVVSKKKGII